jgi:hypothetical protein
LTSAPIPPLLYERLLTLPEGDEDDSGEPRALTSINVSTLLARTGDAAWRFRLAIIFTLIIAIAAGLSVFMPGPTL